MNWSSHPDTIQLARAQGVAYKAGHEYGTNEWWAAFCDAYESWAPNDAKAKAYVQNMRDRHLASPENAS